MNLIYAGDEDQGKILMDKEVALNPNFPNWDYFAYYHYHYLKGQYELALEDILKVNWPGMYWTHILSAAVYGQLGRTEEAHESAKTLLEMYPDYPEHAREEFEIWNRPESAIQQLFEGLRKAGLDIPVEVN